jgi:hypothetical protein
METWPICNKYVDSYPTTDWWPMTSWTGCELGTRETQPISDLTQQIEQIDPADQSMIDRHTEFSAFIDLVQDMPSLRSGSFLVLHFLQHSSCRFTVQSRWKFRLEPSLNGTYMDHGRIKSNWIIVAVMSIATGKSWIFFSMINCTGTVC